MSISREELSQLLDKGKLIDLCTQATTHNSTSKFDRAKNDDENILRKWVDDKIKEHIEKLKADSIQDASKMLVVSCLMGINMAKRKVTSTQLRKILNGFQMVKSSGITPAQISKLKLNLAYVTARNSNIVNLTNVLDSMLDFTNNTKEKESIGKFDAITTFLEGVVAYHKLAGGAD